MTEPLTEEEILEKLVAARDFKLTVEDAEAAVQNFKGYQYVRPLEGVADDLVDVLANVHHRFNIGLPKIDLLTRGFGGKELVLVVGFATAGKTQLVNTMILNNRDKRILFFSLDDPAEMILTKLVSMQDERSAEEVEFWIKKEPDAAGEHVRRHARVTFKNLIIVDASIGLNAMKEAITEATHYWEAPPEAIIIDYMQLMPNGGSEGGYDGTRDRSQAIKKWIKDIACPVIVCHQSTRTHGGPGDELSLVSGSYAGEQEATFMLGVRRKSDAEGLTHFERERDRNTVTLQLLKNKRPPGRKTPYGGVDFFMDPETGMIRDIKPGDLDPPDANDVAKIQDRERRDAERIKQLHEQQHHA
jgi:hypothetical protein